MAVSSRSASDVLKGFAPHVSVPPLAGACGGPAACSLSPPFSCVSEGPPERCHLGRGERCPSFEGHAVPLFFSGKLHFLSRDKMQSAGTERLHPSPATGPFSLGTPCTCAPRGAPICARASVLARPCEGHLRIALEPFRVLVSWSLLFQPQASSLPPWLAGSSASGPRQATSVSMVVVMVTGWWRRWPLGKPRAAKME